MKHGLAELTDDVGDAVARGAGVLTELASTAAAVTGDLASSAVAKTGDLASSALEHVSDVPERIGDLARDRFGPPPKRSKVPFLLLVLAAAAGAALVYWWRQGRSEQSTDRPAQPPARLDTADTSAATAR